MLVVLSLLFLFASPSQVKISGFKKWLCNGFPSLVERSKRAGNYMKLSVVIGD